MKLLELKGVTKLYGNQENAVTALDHIDLTIEEGEFTAIVGTSGSGKSTLLNIIAGLEPITEGDLFYQSKDIKTLSKDEFAILRRNEIGMIYQYFNLISVLTVEENVALPIELAEQKVDYDKLSALLCSLQIQDKRNAFPEQLSGGQQQRVAIARALMQHPSLLLADELTGNLDHATSEDIMELLLTLNKDHHITILYVTHDWDMAKKAKRILHLEDGKIIKDEKRL